MSEATAVSIGTVVPAESPVEVHQDAVVAVPVTSTDQHLIVHIPTVNPHDVGTVEAPGITKAS